MAGISGQLAITSSRTGTAYVTTTVQSGTDLLGLVKHLAGMEFGYFGACFGRPSAG